MVIFWDLAIDFLDSWDQVEVPDEGFGESAGASWVILRVRVLRGGGKERRNGEEEEHWSEASRVHGGSSRSATMSVSLSLSLTVK